MRTSSALFVLAASLAAAPAFAADLDYDTVDVNYQSADLDGVDGDGLLLSASKSFGNDMFGLVRYNGLGFEESGVEANVDVIDVGLGGHWAMTPNADFTLAGGLSWAEVELTIPGFGSGSDDDTGFFIEPGFRAMVTPQFELHGSLYYLDIFDDSETTTTLGGRYFFTPTVALNVAFSSGDDIDSVIAGLRFTF